MAELTWKEAIIAILERAEEPTHYARIAEAIAKESLRTELGATPQATVNATITTSMQREGDGSPFTRSTRGHYALRTKWPAPVAEEHTANVTGLINGFGMYWLRDKVLWKPSTPSLFGELADASIEVDCGQQKGVYLLHDGRTVVYVGRAEDHLGKRLKAHTSDRLNGRWERFSWFGVFPVSEEGKLASEAPADFTLVNLIATMEALLIEGLEPPQNRKRGDDFTAVEFLQIEDPEILKRKLELLT